MAGGITENGRNYLLSVGFGGAAVDATYYMALLLTEPDEDDDGTTINEPSGGSYARASVTNNVTNFPTPTVGVMTNGTDVTFATATADWGLIKYVGICDAVSAGDLLCWFELSPVLEVRNGATATLPANTLSMTLRSAT